MRTRSRWIGSLFLGCAIFAVAQSSDLRAGGFLETVDITNPVPSPIPIFQLVDVTRVRWDPRCIPVPFHLNRTLDPIPNPLPGPPLKLADALPAFAASFRTWNDIPTSYIDMRLGGTTDNPGTAGFDFVNELTFRPNEVVLDENLFAVTSFKVLLRDMFLPAGLDIDEDGDPDVARNIATCRDVDGDGDFELVEGDYPAGTLLDVDVTFNADRRDGFRFTVGDSAVDAELRSVDLQAVATHELGHAHGLAHSLTNQIGEGDGTGSVMFAPLDSGDPASELAGRVLHVEDVAASSFSYPEGTASTGPAALQAGDISFDRKFGLIRGEARHGAEDLPLAGASVFATDDKTGEALGSTITGTVRLILNPAKETSGDVIPALPEIHLLDGEYELPVPLGRSYRIGIEAVDNTPVGGSAVNETVQLGVSLLLQDFTEELYDGGGESDVETRPGRSVLVNVPSHPGSVRDGIDLVTNRVERVGNTRLRNALLLHPSGTFFAVRIPSAALATAVESRNFAVTTALFHTAIRDASVVPRFQRAVLAFGKIEPDGTARVDLGRPVAESRPFFGQDDDSTPFYLSNAVKLGATLRRELDRGTLDSLFLVLEGPDPSAKGGPAVGVVEGGTFSGNSFRSSDGVVFVPETDRDFQFELVLTALD